MNQVRTTGEIYLTLERRIKGAVIYKQHVLTLGLDRGGDSLPMLRAEDQDAQNQQIESALQNSQSFFLLGSHST